MNVIITIIMLQMAPDGVVFRIVKEASVPSLTYCEEMQMKTIELDRLNPREHVKLLSVSCREEVST